MNKLFILAVFLCGSILYPRPVPAADAAHGKTLYRVYCTRDRAEMSARTDDDLFKAIKEGGQAVNKSILMPNWDGNMTDDEIHDVVAYLRELCCAGAK